jgi:hypothetical protein
MTADIFGAGIVDILDYQDTNKNKVIRAFAGLEANSGDTTSNVRLASGMLLSAPAITSISFIPGVGSAFLEHSSLALYGIK